MSMDCRWLSISAAIIILFGVLVSASGLAYGLNQLVNGSFEEGVVGFWQDPRDQPLPPPWNKWDARYAGHPYGNWNINVDGHDNIPPIPPDGQHCASVCAGVNQTSGGIWQEVDVTPGLTFYLSGYYYAGSGWDAGITTTVQFWLFNAPPTFDSSSGDLITTGGVAALNYTGPRTSNWTRFAGGGLTAVNSKIYVVSRFKVGGSWSAYGMHMDKLALYTSPPGTPIPEPSSVLVVTVLSGMLIRLPWIHRPLLCRSCE